MTLCSVSAWSRPSPRTCRVPVCLPGLLVPLSHSQAPVLWHIGAGACPDLSFPTLGSLGMWLLEPVWGGVWGVQPVSTMLRRAWLDI